MNIGHQLSSFRREATEEHPALDGCDPALAAAEVQLQNANAGPIICTVIVLSAHIIVPTALHAASSSSSPDASTTTLLCLHWYALTYPKEPIGLSL